MNWLARRPPAVLLAGDLLAIGLFVLLGERTHATLGLARWLLNLAVFALPYAAAGWLLGAFAAPPELRWSLYARPLNAWLVAVPLGLLARAYLLGSTAIAAPFMAVTLGLGGLFVLAWRAIVFGVGARFTR